MCLFSESHLSQLRKGCLYNHAALHFFRGLTSSLLGHYVSSHTENAFALAACNRNCKGYPHHEGKKRQGLLVNFPPGQLINVSWRIRKNFLIGGALVLEPSRQVRRFGREYGALLWAPSLYALASASSASLLQ